MTARRSSIAWTLVLAVIGCSIAADASAQQITPQPIPPGHGFPTPRAVIDAWVAAGQTARIRQHAWDLWTGMAADSGQSYNGQRLPVWETWYGTDEVFPAGGTPAVATAAALVRGDRKPPRAFVSPSQFHHLARLRGLSATPSAADGQLVSFNKFDPAAADFIVAPHPGPGGGTFAYNTSQGLGALNTAWPASATGQQRGIAEFPETAIETKPVIGLVYAAGLTPQPLWRGLPGATNKVNPTPATWTTCVLIDPKGVGGLRAATQAEIGQAVQPPGSACTSFLYGPLSLFYAFPLSQAEAAAYNAASQPQANAKPGDYAVLLAMHVNTKETRFWTWQTFYWQPGADSPDRFPGSKADQPADLPSPWNNYAMCTAYSQTVRPTGSKMTVCFNPYLETSSGIPAGITSNCVSCHGVALVPGKAATYPAAYRQPIDFFHSPAYFTKSTTHTDFSWAIADAP